MRQGIILLLALFAFSAAMIPRDRRAVNEEEEEPPRADEANATETKENKTYQICPPQTPCGWSVFKPNTRLIEATFANKYCICGEDTNCTLVEIDDSSINAYVHRCRPPTFKSDFES